jgi:hypothetical protein
MKKRAYVVLLVAAAVVFQTVGMANVYGERDIPLSGLNRGKGTEASERYAPQRTGWGIVKMAEAVRDAVTAPPDAPPTPGAARIACLPDLPYLNAATLAAHVAATGVPARPVDLADPDLRVRRLRLAEADFIVESDGYQGPKERTAGNDELRDGLKRADLAGRSALRQIGAYPLPDGSTAWLLTRESGGR